MLRPTWKQKPKVSWLGVGVVLMTAILYGTVITVRTNGEKEMISNMCEFAIVLSVSLIKTTTNYPLGI